MHIPVLLQETIEKLAIKPGDIFLDATLGSGGHSRLICQLFGDQVTIVGIDEDASAVKRSQERFRDQQCRLIARIGNFRNLDLILDELRIPKVNKILFDLGLSSEQFNQSGRGFSFQQNEPLLMTMSAASAKNGMTAVDIVNSWAEENIATILKAYGEEQFAEKIARAIVEARSRKPIKTTFELVEIVKRATPRFYHSRKIHPATKTFQALRITVNDEIAALKEGLNKGFTRLSAGGRMAAISFHSLEDRAVKNFFKERVKINQATLISKKPMIPSREEMRNNPRSRSAKLRILEKKNFNKDEKQNTTTS